METSSTHSFSYIIVAQPLVVITQSFNLGHEYRNGKGDSVVPEMFVVT